MLCSCILSNNIVLVFLDAGLLVNLNLKIEISHSSAMSPGVTIQDFADGNP